jgi:hypothetical protein
VSEVTVRELGGEIWAELFCEQRDGQAQLRGLRVETTEALIDLILGVLARHVGDSIKNDLDLPVAPRSLRNNDA